MSDEVLYVVEARVGSAEHAWRLFADFRGSPVLEFLLRRIGPGAAGPVMVLTSDASADDQVVTLAQAAGVAARRVSGRTLRSLVPAVDELGVETVVLLRADCPLLDPAVVDDALTLHRACAADYTSNLLPRTFPKGLDVEVVGAAALWAAAAEAADPAEREQVTPFLYRRPERFALANLTSGDDLGDERWTVGTPEDLQALERIVSSIPRDEALGWREVVRAMGRRAPTSGHLRLRPAREDDRDRILAWRNDADSVRFSTSRSRVDAAEHESWFAQNVHNPGMRMWIGELHGTPIGYIRVEVTTGRGVVSIVVAPEGRGKGRGRELLEALQQRCLDDHQVTSLVAVVRSANVASQRIFTRCGFQPAGERVDELVFEWAVPRWDVAVL